MPSASTYLTNRKASRTLIVGDPGGGKSSAVAYLALSPLISRVFCMDLDDNWRGPLRLLPPEALAKIHIETIKDRTRFDVGKKYVPIIKGVPEAFPQIVRLLDRWVDSETGEDFGRPDEWSPSDVLVLDGMSGLAPAAMNYTVYAANRVGLNKRIKDWYNAIERFEGIIQALNAELPCHVVVTAHLARLSPDSSAGDDDDDNAAAGKTGYTRGGQTAPENFWMRYPSALGQKLPPRIGGMFEMLLQAKRVGSGLGHSHVLKITPDDDVDVKLPVRQKDVFPDPMMEIPNTDLIKIISASCALKEAA